MDAIVYTSNTGSAKQYALWMAEETGLPVYSLTEAKQRLTKGATIVYFGWVMASGVKGYSDAAKRYRIQAVCAVGMGQTGTQGEVIRKKECDSIRRCVIYAAGKLQCEKTARDIPSADGIDGKNRGKRTGK